MMDRIVNVLRYAGVLLVVAVCYWFFLIYLWGVMLGGDSRSLFP